MNLGSFENALLVGARMVILVALASSLRRSGYELTSAVSVESSGVEESREVRLCALAMAPAYATAEKMRLRSILYVCYQGSMRGMDRGKIRKCFDSIPTHGGLILSLSIPIDQREGLLETCYPNCMYDVNDTCSEPLNGRSSSW